MAEPSLERQESHLYRGLKSAGDPSGTFLYRLPAEIAELSGRHCSFFEAKPESPENLSSETDVRITFDNSDRVKGKNVCLACVILLALGFHHSTMTLKYRWARGLPAECWDHSNYGSVQQRDARHALQATNLASSRTRRSIPGGAGHPRYRETATVVSRIDRAAKNVA